MKAWTSQFYYITHIDNLQGLFTKGILSHNLVDANRLKPNRISDREIVDCRKSVVVDEKKGLWDYANVYFRPKNAMLYKMVNSFSTENIVVLGIDSKILKIPGTFITTGNARSPSTSILQSNKIREVLKELYPFMGKEWWENGNDKIRMMAECLVPDKIPVEYIKSIYVSSHEMQKRVKQRVGEQIETSGLNIIPDPDLFFTSKSMEKITENLCLVHGDMIFSNLQTLTVSVNTVGVMGAGLAARVKYQFGDVYAYYKGLCDKKSLHMGEPIIYKRDKLISQELGIGSSFEGEQPTWFLLFPTKDHYKNKSDIKGIEEGLIWLKNHYKGWGIKSLALPALGCGKGWLEWKDVGPIMVRHLKDFDIPVEIYLPREKEEEKVYIRKEYLLKDPKQKILSNKTLNLFSPSSFKI